MPALEARSVGGPYHRHLGLSPGGWPILRFLARPSRPWPRMKGREEASRERGSWVEGQGQHWSKARVTTRWPWTPQRRRVSQKMVAPLLGLGTENAGGLAWPDSNPTPLWVHTMDKVEVSVLCGSQFLWEMVGRLTFTGVLQCMAVLLSPWPRLPLFTDSSLPSSEKPFSLSLSLYLPPPFDLCPPLRYPLALSPHPLQWTRESWH